MNDKERRDLEKLALIAAGELAAQRVLFAKEWQFARAKVNSDMHATQIAIERTDDAVTAAQTRLRIAERRLSE